MREILFRGKRLDNGEFIYGFYTCFEVAGILKYGVFPLRHDINNKNIKDNEFLVDPKTIGQYTGLQHKKQVKIFEGDIVSVTSKTDTSYNSIIKFKRSKFCFYLTNCSKHEYPYRDLYGWVEIEVTGNIYEKIK